MKSASLAFVLSALLLCASSYATLTPDASMKTLIVSLGTGSATTRFSLTNDGADAITITKTQTSCNCTSVTLDKKSITSHETISATATIDTSAKAGTGDEAIALYVVNEKRPLVLRIHIEAADVVAASSKNVEWNIGENPAAKTIKVDMAKGVEGTIIRVSANENPMITVSTSQNVDGSFSAAFQCPGTEVSFSGPTTLSVTAKIDVDGKHFVKTQRIPVMVTVSSPPTTKPSK